MNITVPVIFHPLRLEEKPFHSIVHILTGFLQYYNFVATYIRVQGQNVFPVLIHITSSMCSRKEVFILFISIYVVFFPCWMLRMKARETNIACIAISETWLDDNVFDSELSILNYNIHRRDRNRHGGSVCLYIRSDISFNTREDLQHQDLESLWMELLLPNAKPIHPLQSLEQ